MTFQFIPGADNRGGRRFQRTILIEPAVSKEYAYVGKIMVKIFIDCYGELFIGSVTAKQ